MHIRILTWWNSRESGSLLYFELQYHTYSSSEWYSIYGLWICIRLLYSFCGSEKIKIYLKKWSWPWYLLKMKDTNLFYAPFGPLQTMQTLKSVIFWDIMPCSPLNCNQHFRGTYRLHLLGWKNNSAGTSKKAGVIISQKMILFITTTVETSIPTQTLPRARD
jgi:hypothetical protein